MKSSLRCLPIYGLQWWYANKCSTWFPLKGHIRSKHVCALHIYTCTCVFNVITNLKPRVNRRIDTTFNLHSALSQHRHRKLRFPEIPEVTSLGIPFFCRMPSKDCGYRYTRVRCDFVSRVIVRIGLDIRAFFYSCGKTGFNRHHS